ncbi:MAG: 16S rRNA (guanine(527)-N(7))-methyltransferase RsmG [Chloroflexi bacterium]|nr:16S rRNA (guanine(527)-N(7))-methyltransferase RsmG [Chloroflexota bacterium]
MSERLDSPLSKASMEPEPWQRLREGAEALGAPLNATQIELFQRYTALLLEANQRFNLTAIRNTPEIVSKLHLDSLALLKPISQAAGCSVDELRKKSWFIADIGAGAGIPGIPIHIAWPDSHLLLVESVGKKHKFLTSVISGLGLNARAVCRRAEDLGQDEAFRERCNLVVARAVAELPTLVELILPFLRIDGIAALPKGPKAEEELIRATRAIELLGGEVIGLEKVKTPGIQETRLVALLRKKRPTPARYPRRPGLPRKRPLQ